MNKNTMIVKKKEKERYEAGNYRLRSALKKKGTVLLILLTVAVAVTLIVYKYFYYLDAYFYTGEFYWLFNVNNLKTANIAIFTEFFRPMGILSEALPQVIFSNLVQSYYLPFTKPILVQAIIGAFGPWPGVFLSFSGLFVVGLISFGLGSFFFGDILPYLKKNGFEQYQKALSFPASMIFPVFFAIPFFPVSVIAIGAAVLKIPFRKVIPFMVPGLILRIFWLLGMAFLTHDISAILMH